MVDSPHVPQPVKRLERDVPKATWKGHGHPSKVWWHGALAFRTEPTLVTLSQSKHLLHVKEVATGEWVVAIGFAVKFWAMPVESATMVDGSDG